LPLSKRARIEIYLPADERYSRLQTVFEREFLYTFGGCTVVRNIKGSYMAADRTSETEEINLVYADVPFGFDENLEALSRYTDSLKRVALKATKEESVLIVVHQVFHSV
jgi:hypothetical protein